MNYMELYSYYEESNLHIGLTEVEDAETDFAILLRRIADPELRNEIDMAAGSLTRAYEKQGFAFAEAVYTRKAATV